MYNSNKIKEIINTHLWSLIIPLLVKFILLVALVAGEVLLRNKLALPVYIDYYGTPSSLADDIINPQPLSIIITLSFSFAYFLIFPVISQGMKSLVLNAVNPSIRRGFWFWFIPKYWFKVLLLRIRTTLGPTLIFLGMIVTPMYTAPYLITYFKLPQGLPGEMIRLAFWVLGLSATFCLFGFYLGICSRWFLAPYLLSIYPQMPLSDIIKASSEHSKGKRFFIMSYRLAQLPFLICSCTILPAFYFLPYRHIKLTLLAEKLIFAKQTDNTRKNGE